jgi:signal transduction histidine kinase
MRDAPDKRGTEEISQAVAEADRLQRTIDDLLALARDVPRRAEPLDLNDLLDEVRQTRYAELAAQGRPLRIRVAPHVPTTHASSAAAHQILDVLLDNATRHGPER